jgi:heptosyltransferase-2
VPRSLVIQTSFLGDVILTTPLLTALAARGPVDVVATPMGASLLTGHPAVRRLHTYDKRGGDSGIGGFRRLVGQVRAEDPSDTAYLAQGSVRSAALALAGGFASRLGFASSAGRWLYTQRVPYERGQHHAQRLRSLAGTVQVPNEPSLRPRLYPGAADETAVDVLLQRAGVLPGEPLIALAPGSVWLTKRWPWFPDLARLLPGDHRVVVVGSAADRDLANAIIGAAGGRAVDATGQLSLLASAALIGRARVLVTNDSAPLHMASAMNTPTVAVFGPTVPRFGFGPLADARAIAEVTHLTCRPCHAHGPMQCPLTHFRCMRDLTADRVLALAASLGGA